MPVTPYHFGPALVVKALYKKRFCLYSFAASQLIIDLESLYHLITQSYPIHRFFHSYLGATIAIILAIVITKPMLSVLGQKPPWAAISFGAVFGGYSHVVLDSIMHLDMRPLAPLSQLNTLLRIIDLPTLHEFCILTAIIGTVIIIYQKLKSPSP